MPYIIPATNITVSSKPFWNTSTSISNDKNLYVTQEDFTQFKENIIDVIFKIIKEATIINISENDFCKLFEENMK